MKRNIARRKRLLLYQTIDSAALAGAVIAVSFTPFTIPGPFYPINAIIGLTLLTLLISYELKRCREGWQNVAFGMICALCGLLVVGFVTDFVGSGGGLDYYKELEEQERSLLGLWAEFVWWLVLTVVFTYLGFRNATPVSELTENQDVGNSPPKIDIT